MKNHDFVGEGSVERAATEREKLMPAVKRAASRLLEKLASQLDPNPDGTPGKGHSERRSPPHVQ